MRCTYDGLIAIDTGPGAGNLFAYRPPPGKRMAILVGNERRGLSPATLRAADILLQIPMRPPAGHSLNVAAAAAVALSHLRRSARDQRAPPRSTRRPDLVLLHPFDPAELGSTLRSAWALGWDQVYLADRHEVWFSRDRATYVQGRGAARRHKNPLQVRPYDSARLVPYDLGLVVTLRGPGPPLARVRLPPGAPVAVVLPDESRGAPGCDSADYTQIARRVQYAHLDVPNPAAPYHYRLTTAMVLAELARRQA